MGTNREFCRILAAFVLAAGSAAVAKDAGNAYVQPREGHFERMMFNNPGLEVDLSLGIWPHVSVYDYDRDGKNDIVVREGDAGDVLRGPWGGHADMFRDFDADGVPDLVIAAEDGYFYYMKNPRSLR